MLAVDGIISLNEDSISGFVAKSGDSVVPPIKHKKLKVKIDK